jgi:hypothetical protein
VLIRVIREICRCRDKAMLEDYTPYQQKIIERYYANQDLISFQRLSELVSDLYLSEGKKKKRVWKAIANVLQKLGFPQPRIDHLLKQGNPSLVVEVIKELEKSGR